MPHAEIYGCSLQRLSVVGHECIADDLQRRLWHTGFWGATGIGRWSTHMIQTQVLGGLSWQNKLRVERIVAWANLTQVTPANCWPGIAARRCNARSLAELAAGTAPTDPLIASVHADMLALGFTGGLPDMELVVHSDRRTRERPAREAGALGCIGKGNDAEHGTSEQRLRSARCAMPNRLVTAGVADATKNWWNATNFLEPKSAHRWARLWGNRFRECPIPEVDLDDEISDDGSDGATDSGAESDDGEEPESPRKHLEEVQTVRVWGKKLLAVALTRQHAEWTEQRDDYEASHGCMWLNAGSSYARKSRFVSFALLFSHNSRWS